MMTEHWTPFMAKGYALAEEAVETLSVKGGSTLTAADVFFGFMLATRASIDAARDAGLSGTVDYLAATNKGFVMGAIAAAVWGHKHKDDYRQDTAENA